MTSPSNKSIVNKTVDAEKFNKSSATIDTNETISSDMETLLNHQKEIQQWQNAIQSKIYELETSYLDDPNSFGNIIKGWDVDGKTLSFKRGIEDRDRVFSLSSYAAYKLKEGKTNYESQNQELERKLSLQQISNIPDVSINLLQQQRDKQPPKKKSR